MFYTSFIKGEVIITTLLTLRHQPINFPPSYFSYYKKYKRVIGRLGLNEAHRPHDARKTFITRAKKKGLDEFAIKRLVGHAISDITERVYTERDVEWLREEINKL